MNHYPEEPIETTGTVVFLLSNIGTKSEGIFPFLYVNQNTMYKLHLRDDDSFEERGLFPYDGKRVIVSGVKIEDIKKSVAAGTLIADTVVLADEPENPPEDSPQNEAESVPAEKAGNPPATAPE